MSESRIPNTNSPEEVRRAFAALGQKGNIITKGAAGEVLVGVAVGSLPAWGTELTAITKLVVDNITIDGAVITSDTGAISFGNENLSTSGTIGGVNVTSGADPGHTHTIYLKADGSVELTGDMAVASGVTIDGRDLRLDGQDLDLLVLIIGKMKVDSSATADYLGATFNSGTLRTSTGISFADGGNFVTLTTNDGEIDHGSLAGIGDDDHTDYHTDGRAATWLTAGHETTYNHTNFGLAYGWGDHDGLYDAAGTAAAAVGTHESTYNHGNFNTAYDWGDHASGGYLKADGSVALTSDWTTGAHSIIGSDHWYLRADNAKLYFGAGDDASIYHTGANFELDTSTGHIIISPTGRRVGVGELGAAVSFYVATRKSSLSQAWFSIVAKNTFGATAGSSSYNRSFGGMTVIAETDPAYSGDSLQTLYGLTGVALHRGTGTAARVMGLSFTAGIGTTGKNVTEAYGVSVKIQNNSTAGGQLDTAYGLYVWGVNDGTTANYAIFTNNGIVYLKDSVGIGVTAPDEALQVVGNIHVDDNYKSIYGTGKDATIYYDDTDLVINPKEVGAGKVDILGTLQTDGYNSSDGTAGATADVAVAKVGGGTRTLHFKDGLYTSYTDS